jgi:hypothetical protein
MNEDNIYLRYHGWLGRGILRDDVTTQPDNSLTQIALTPDKSNVAGAICKGQMSNSDERFRIVAPWVNS